MKTLFDEYGTLIIVCISGMLILSLFCDLILDRSLISVKEYIRYTEVEEVN